MLATAAHPEPASSFIPKIRLTDVWSFAWRDVIRPNARLCFGWLMLAGLGTLPALIVAQLFGFLIKVLDKDGGVTEQGAPWLPFFGWAVILLLVSPGLNLAQSLVSSRLDQRMTSWLRWRTFEAVLARPLPFFHKQDRGSLLYTLRDMCIECQIALRQLSLEAVMHLVHLFTALALVLYNLLGGGSSGQMGGNFLVVAGLLVLGLASPFLTGRFARRFQGLAADLRDVNMSTASLVEGSLQAPEEVKAFGAEHWLVRKYRGLLAQLNSARERQTLAVAKANIVNSLPADLVQVCLVGAALVVAANAAGKGAGTMVTVLLLAPQLMRPLQGLSQISMTFNSSQPSLQGIMELLGGVPGENGDEKGGAAPAHPQAVAGSAASSKIQARGLGFQYPGAKGPVLEGFDLDVPAGQVTALVAKMGAGKSTLFRLLLRFYEPGQGTLALDGVPVTALPLPEVRRRIGLLAQFPSFTHDSVRENFHLAAPEATDEEILALCRQVDLLPILEEKLVAVRPGQPVLDRPFASGGTLSGGQRKLFGLVRCLLRSPEVLLLDEPTTGLDNDSKEFLSGRLPAIFAGRTVIVVDHDVQWLAGGHAEGRPWCHRFAVLEEGRIAAAGTLEEVCQASPLFVKLLRAKPRAAEAPPEDLASVSMKPRRPL